MILRALFILISLISSDIAVAGDEKFAKVMKKAIAGMDTCKTTECFMSFSNQFERIANAEKQEWLPAYYAAYALTIASYSTPNDKKDQVLDQAEKLLTVAEGIKKDEAEILFLRSMISSSRIGVDPRTRGMKYGPEANAYMEAGHKLDPENPRYYFLKGSSFFYTPAMFGGGKDKAQPVLEEAVKKFSSYTPASEIHPNWGKEQAEQLLAKCKE